MRELSKEESLVRSVVDAVVWVVVEMVEKMVVIDCFGDEERGGGWW